MNEDRCEIKPRVVSPTAKTMDLFGHRKQQFIWFLGLLSLPLCTDCGNVRLWPNKCAGRVEVLYDGRWGTVCDDHWSLSNSQVLCRELECGPMISSKKGLEIADGEIWLDDVRCRGNESSILECKHSDLGEHNCDHSEDAGVVCSDPMKLSNGTNRCSGTLEVFYEGQWGVFCSTSLTPNQANKLCESLDCGYVKTMDATLQKYMGYTSGCPANATSISECTLTKNNDVCPGLALSCEGFREIRLKNGSDQCSGRVEVYFHKQWGTVCDDNWDMMDAQVVCRSMDCGVALEVLPNAHFGEGEGEIWLDSVECVGNESGLVNCEHNPIGDHNCGHAEDASVVCSSHIRLINGTTSCSGRVEFNVAGRWASARTSSWGMNEAMVVCREMDCGEALSFSGSNSANEPMRMFDVTCTGTESSLKECTVIQYNKTSGGRTEDATVVCTGKTILSDGPNRCSGRVEVYHNGQWADVCTDSWDIFDAEVLCKQLGCGSPHKLITTPGRAGAKVWVSQTVCSGREVSLSFCSMDYSNQTCGSTSVAGVICSDGLVVRLGNGQDRCSGRVEVHRGDSWGTVCDSNWSQSKAKVVCDLLECGHVINVTTGRTYPPGVGPVYDASESCFSSLAAIHKCSLNGFSSSICGHDKDIGIICGGDSSIRLVNGTDRCSGRVEVLHRASWGTVCDDDWDIMDAQVVCRSRDCGSAMMAVPGAFFGEGTGNIWLDDVNCLGNETSLAQCQHPELGNNNCGHREDAGVICSAHLRLFDGPDQCSGSVEVYYDGEWLPALNTKWGMNEAAVVCREMNCGDPKTVSGSFSQTAVHRGFKVSCTGRERSISLCTIRPYTRTSMEQLRYATVTCSDIVKLMDGPNRCVGRVEVFHNGVWGDVCGQSWDKNDAEVVCQQLNCGKAFKLTTDPNLYGYGKNSFVVEHIECNGQESLLRQCAITHGDKDCNSTSAAAVACSDSLNIRLVGGADRCTGRVEVRMGSVWGSVCGAGWSMERAETVCELLECGQAVNMTKVPHRPASPLADPPQTCFNSAQNLKQCLHNGLPRSTCAQDTDASLSCAAQLRLVGGPNACTGRVEVFHKGEWGTVCDDDWGMEDAKVVCRQLGCGLPVTISTGSSFGRGTGQIWLDNVECRGTETVLTQCPHNDWGNHNCGHDEDSGVTCLDTLEKPKLLMNPGPEVNWGNTVDLTCTLSTHQTGGTFTLKKMNDTLTIEKSTDNQAAVFTLIKINLNHSGFYYCEYSKKAPRELISFPQGVAVQLTVTVRPEKPSISMTSLYPIIISSQDNMAISKGHSCNLICSVHSVYPGGFFYLTKSNVKASETKPAVNQTDQVVAVFEFPYIQYLHQGEYRCVFGVSMSSQTFESSPSGSIQVTVVANTTSIAVGVVVTIFLLVILAAVGYFVWRKQSWSTDNMGSFVSRLGGALQGIKNKGRAGPAVPQSFSNINMDMDGIEEAPGIVFHDHEPLVYTN